MRPGASTASRPHPGRACRWPVARRAPRAGRSGAPGDEGVC